MNKNTIIALIATTIMLASLFGGCGIDKRTVSVKTATVKKTTTTIKVKFKTNSDYKRSLINEAGIVYSPKKSTLAYTYGTTKDSEEYKTVENMGTKPATQFSAAKSAKVKVKKKLGKKKTFKRTLKVKNLEPGTKYYYRAFVKAKYYGQNGKTWETYQYYKVKSFKTKGKAPFVPAVPFLSANFGKIFPAPPVVLAWGKVKNALGMRYTNPLTAAPMKRYILQRIRKFILTQR
jgi:hypothetical protein